MNVVNQLFSVKTEHLSLFVDGGLYGLDKDKTPNQPYNCTYPDCNSDLIQPISDLIPNTNIRVDSSIEHGLLFQTPTLLNEERDLLDRFDNDSVVRLDIDEKSVSTPISPEPSFFRTPDEKNMSDSKWELTTLGNARNPYLPKFEEAERVIEKALGFQPNPWQINGLLDVKNGRDTVVLAGT